MRTSTYQNGMALFNQDRCRHNFEKIESFKHLIQTLDHYGGMDNQEIRRFKPVFILVGHGNINTGYMNFMKHGDGALVPQRLVNNWRPQIPCDFIATQCYSHSFSSVVANPCLMKLDNVRFLSAGDSAKPETESVVRTTPQGTISFHVELMSLLETYLHSYPELVQPDFSILDRIRKSFSSLRTSVFRKHLASPQPLALPPPTPVPTPVPEKHNYNPYLIITLLLIGSLMGLPILLGLLFLYYCILPRINTEKLVVIVIISIITHIPIPILYLFSYKYPKIEGKYYRWIVCGIVLYHFTQ